MQPYVLKLKVNNTENVETQPKLSETTDQSNFGVGKVHLLKKFLTPPLAEFFGTAVLTFLSMVLSLPSTNQQLSSAIFEGAVTFVLMCLFGDVSGGHFNPALTLSVGFVGHCRLVLGGCIVFSQFLGSFIAGLLLRAFLADAAFNSTFNYGVSTEEKTLFTNSPQAFFFEVLLVFFLCSAYLFQGVRLRGQNGKLCALIIGITRSVITFVGYRTIGHAANMALSFGNSIAEAFFLCRTKLWSLLYISIFSNLIGAFLAALCYW